MFCGKCGSKNEDGAKFCSSCGAPLMTAAPAAAPVEPEPAPVQPEPAPVQPAAAPVQPEPTPVQPAAAPVQPEPTPVQPAAAPVQPEPAPVQPEPAPVQPEPTPVQPEPTPVQPAANTFVQPAPAAPVAPVAPVAPAKKKKGKGGLIAGITAAVVVLGGAAVGYFCFHADITRMIMGDANYAKMLERGLVKDTGVEEESVYTTLNITSQSAGTAYKSFSTLSSDTSGETASMDITEQILASGLIDKFDAADVPEGTVLFTQQNLNVKLGSVFAILDNETTRKILDTINSAALTSKIANGSTKLYSIGVTDNKGHEGTAEFYRNDTGILIAFPGISDTKVFIPQSDIDAAKSKLANSTKTVKGLDPEELKRIRKEIVEIYSNSLDNASITYTKNITWSEELPGNNGKVTASVTGTDAAISLSAEQTADVVVKIFEFLGNDEYLVSYVNEAFGINKETYSSFFATDNIKKNTKATVIVHHIVDVHNNVLASSLELLGDGSVAFRFSGITDSKNNSNYFGASVSDKDNKGITISAGTQKTNAADGITIVKIDSTIPDLKIEDVRFECSFTGTGTKKFAGKDVSVGRYVITPSDPDRMLAPLEEIFNKADEKAGTSISPKGLLDELKKITITFDSSIENDVYTTSAELSAGDIGSIGWISRTEARNETVEMPDASGAYKIDDPKLYEKIGEDSAGWLHEFAGSLGISDELLAGLLGGGLTGDPKPSDSIYANHYKNYNEYSEYLASDYASSIYNVISSKMYEGDKKYGTGIIKMYFTDGKPEIIDNAGFDGLEDIDYTGGYLDEVLDAAYVEVHYTDVPGYPNIGVNVVLTDDRYDIPANLPGIFNFIDFLYPWEDETGFIGDYIVGTAPYLMKGEPTTTTIPEPEPEEPEFPENGNGESTGYDGTWVLTAINGNTVSELLQSGDFKPEDLDIVFSIDGDTITRLTGAGGQDPSEKLVYGETYGGEEAAALVNDSGETEAYFILADDGTAVLYDVKNDVSFSLKNIDRMNSDEFLMIEDVEGKWTATDEDGEKKTVIIDSNYILAFYDEDYWLTNDDYYLLNPHNDGMDVFETEADENDLEGKLTYNKEDDTALLILDGDTIKLTREETFPSYQYLGAWTIDTYEGMNVDEYCEKYNKTPDEFAGNFDIGAYCGLLRDNTGTIILTQKMQDGNSFKLAMGSAFFFDCTYDPETDTITAVLRSDGEGDSAQTAVLKRGYYSFGTQQG